MQNATELSLLTDPSIFQGEQDVAGELDTLEAQIMALAEEIENGTVHRSIQSIQDAKRRLFELQIDFDLAHISSHVEASPTPDEIMRAEILSLIDKKYEHVNAACAQSFRKLTELLSEAA